MNQKPTEGSYLVLCRKDRKPDGDQGDYEVATSQEFPTLMQAEHFAVYGVSSSREPIVVTVASLVWP